jgi:hypothetical protein
MPDGTCFGKKAGRREAGVGFFPDRQWSGNALLLGTVKQNPDLSGPCDYQRGASSQGLKLGRPAWLQQSEQGIGKKRG